jgi:hypothetical protein
MTDTPVARLGLLWRQNASAETERARLQPIFAAFAALHVDAVPVLYTDETAAAVRGQLLQLDGVLVWVDPLSFGQDRAHLDALLRDVAAHGTWVSAHPDVILKMGTKDVLFDTRQLGWGTDTDLYRTAREFQERFPHRLATTGPRVVKQYRGNGGQGVWKVELLGSGATVGSEASCPVPGPDAPVRVLHAQRNSLEEDLPLGDFMARCAEYFAGFGHLIDQPFQARLADGVIRCYLSQDVVIGFAQQFVRQLMPAPAGSDLATLPQPGPRIMQSPSTPAFAVLRQQMEAEWLPGMCQVLGLERSALPVLWDADFLFGPKTTSGQDTYVLSEINVSCITPFPEFAAGQIAQAAVNAVSAAKRGA